MWLWDPKATRLQICLKSWIRMIITSLKFLKLPPWFFLFIFDIFLLVCLFPFALTVKKEVDQLQKFGKIRKFCQNHQKSKNFNFFHKPYHESLDLLLNSFQFQFQDNWTIFDDFMTIWKKKSKKKVFLLTTVLISKKLFFLKSQWKYFFLKKKKSQNFFFKLS